MEIPSMSSPDIPTPLPGDRQQASLTFPPIRPRYLGVLTYSVELASGDLFELVTAHRYGNGDGFRRLREKILGLADIVNCDAFVEMLVGHAAVELLRQAPGTDYHTAEFLIRATLRKFVPELRVALMADCGSA
jgi:hypothetical protein